MAADLLPLPILSHLLPQDNGSISHPSDSPPHSIENSPSIALALAGTIKLSTTCILQMECFLQVCRGSQSACDDPFSGRSPPFPSASLQQALSHSILKVSTAALLSHQPQSSAVASLFLHLPLETPQGSLRNSLCTPNMNSPPIPEDTFSSLFFDSYVLFLASS